MASHDSTEGSVRDGSGPSESRDRMSQPEVPQPPPITVEAMFDLLQRLAPPQAPQPPPTRDVLVRDHARFKKYGGVEFTGTTDPIEAEQWLERIERVAYDMQCDDSAKFDYAVHLLQGNAYEWWRTVPHYDARPPVLTWTDFVRYFRAKYVPSAWVQAKQQQFVTLVQGSRRVAEYEEEFIRLSRYGKELIPDDARKCERFVQGLHPYLRGPVAARGFTDFAQMMSFCHEQELIEEEKASLENRVLYPVSSAGTTVAPRMSASQPVSTSQHRQSRRGGSQHRQRSRRHPYSRGSQSGSESTAMSASSVAQPPQSAARPPQCSSCHRFHWGNCRSMTGACYTCGQQGHYARDCPQTSVGSAPIVTQSQRQPQTTQSSMGSRGRGRGRGPTQRVAAMVQTTGPQDVSPPVVQSVARGTEPVQEAGPSIPSGTARVYAMQQRETTDASNVVIGGYGAGQ